MSIRPPTPTSQGHREEWVESSTDHTNFHWNCLIFQQNLRHQNNSKDATISYKFYTKGPLNHRDPLAVVGTKQFIKNQNLQTI